MGKLHRSSSLTLDSERPFELIAGRLADEDAEDQRCQTDDEQTTSKRQKKAKQSVKQTRGEQQANGQQVITRKTLSMVVEIPVRRAHSFNAPVADFVAPLKQEATKSKHGPFRRVIPAMPLSLAVLCCIFNFIVPGLGTFVSAFSILVGCGATEDDLKLKAFGMNLLAAFLQLLTAALIVGFAWSIIWGIIFVNLAKKWWLRVEERDHTLSLLNIADVV